ncbi:hypothetical protein A3C86_00670 [Candidatus Kaiserbacteria bacterium RIFCSPHIGHO2_02_FULL_49_16]|uniref:Pilus assembly protein PilO n=1 Tax=Candidatus Kaiserbacteria bacterium RIFCSPHIGHO2_02_FULL_49_16 TaxID=1798490 RepID=A0A1F6DDH2_9BACT|nr:MAG: hypothetical protein A3C86_00670 [Candidatus Kaiserbacteria bacterium RIFCSPHIGHO2_02_FULL_49_16]
MVKTIISIASLVIAGAVFFMYTEPTYGKTQALQKEIDQRNLALDKATELKKRQETLLAQYNAFNPDAIDRLHKLLPDHVDNVRLILDLDRLASRFGMAVQNVVISRSLSETSEKTVIGSIASGKQGYDSLTLKFSTHGTYSNFMKFMESLESSLRIVDLASLYLLPDAQSNSSTARPSSVIGGGSKTASGQIQTQETPYRYDITLRTYWLK